MKWYDLMCAEPKLTQPLSDSYNAVNSDGACRELDKDSLFPADNTVERLLMSNVDSDPTPQPSAGDAVERRRTARYDCKGHAVINTIPYSGMQHRGTLRNLSLGGCNLEFASPYPPATRLELMLYVNKLSLRVSGIVRSRRLNGMGIEFDLMSATGRHCLTELVREFQSEESS